MIMSVQESAGVSERLGWEVGSTQRFCRGWTIKLDSGNDLEVASVRSVTSRTKCASVTAVHPLYGGG